MPVGRKNEKKIRNLILVFGDQLDAGSAAFDGFDAGEDAVVMMEVKKEATYVPQHKIRIALFFSAMRHFADDLKERGYTVYYAMLDDPNNRGSFGAEITRWVNKTRPECLICVRPGDFRVLESVQKAAKRVDCKLEVRPDRHFMSTIDDFKNFAKGRKSLILETFYRKMRRDHDILMTGKDPVGGQWNFDKDNRGVFGKKGPPKIKAPRSFRPDPTTRDVMKLVERAFPDSPGRLDNFDYPVTRKQALAALKDFVTHRLTHFGTYQDAMVTDHPYLYHSRLSCVLNLHLLDPRKTIDDAVGAYRDKNAPINSVEGFVRQILGWREFVRGVYWLKMPEYAEMNALEADLPMPAFMWTAETEMHCIRQCIEQLIDTAYAHHIQRLMVMGLFLLLLGVRPYEVHQWHLSMYADAIDWVSLPNVLGMSQYGDGGIIGTKPYSATGNYINKMSNYCPDCIYDYKTSIGDNACPFTTLYWDFLARNRKRLSNNPRMGLQLRNLARKSDSGLKKIRKAADRLKRDLTRNTYL
ncbi:deoxyribodipyrimidine photolyase-related protein [Olavius algarvensis associated proteobacterium Delta 3]|nr:deoxyribodipyrimidine photolyase-related protein [Olavius algarvensis associated proteobacterium Delta 3]CAB5136571.1 deoxyribodipyrimidine photolyase-related protein [Olavius algarvensis associated proteobacterium Delta 3]